MKSNEYDIRSCVVAALLNDGWDRRDIRLEIPMSTNSGTGRADIVVLGDSYAGCIELKSGKDKFCTVSLKDQMRPYRLVFDYCRIIADQTHHEEVTIKKGGATYKKDNFNCVDMIYQHGWEKGKLLPCRYGSTRITDALFRKWGRNQAVSVYHMASVLWADELRQIFSNDWTKNKNEIHARDHYGAADFRSLFIKAIKARPMNEWESSFWKEFDKPDTRTEEEKHRDLIRKAMS